MGREIKSLCHPQKRLSEPGIWAPSWELPEELGAQDLSSGQQGFSCELPPEPTGQAFSAWQQSSSCQPCRDSFHCPGDSSSKQHPTSSETDSLINFTAPAVSHADNQQKMQIMQTLRRPNYVDLNLTPLAEVDLLGWHSGQVTVAGGTL